MSDITNAGGNGSPTMERPEWMKAWAAAERHDERQKAVRGVYEMLARQEAAMLDSAKAACMEVVNRMHHTLNYIPEVVYLTDWETEGFEAVFFVTDDVFKSDSFDSAYDIAWSVQEEMEASGYTVEIDFAPVTEEVNHKALQADGFYNWRLLRPISDD